MEKGIERLKKRHIKKRRRMIIICCLLLIIAALSHTGIKKMTAHTVTVTVPEGASSQKIAEILKDNGVIESKTLFMLRLRFSEYNGKLQYGTFKLDTDAPGSEIIKTLATKGAKKNTVTLTVPEGYSVEKIKARVCELGLCTEDEFEKALKKDYDFGFLKAIPSNKKIKYRLQGFLFPSTYEFYSDASAEDIIKTMLSEFEKQTSALSIKNDEMFEIITKASIIEREAGIDSERAKIAGVIENRLKSDMLLQIDATVVYAISDGMYDVDRVYYKNLETDSPYNTYKYKGLPAGPICCPGINSIKAAKNPSKHGYLYYHTDTAKNDGSHIFTETYDQHTSTQN